MPLLKENQANCLRYGPAAPASRASVVVFTTPLSNSNTHSTGRWALMASALAVPLLTPLGRPFPYRNLLLFSTFVVILVTLVVQGLTLLWLIRRVNLTLEHPAQSEAEQELFIQQQLAQQALRFAENQAGAAHEYARNLQVRLALDNQFLLQAIEGEDGAAAALHQYLQLLQR